MWPLSYCADLSFSLGSFGAWVEINLKGDFQFLEITDVEAMDGDSLGMS